MRKINLKYCYLFVLLILLSASCEKNNSLSETDNNDQIEQKDLGAFGVSPEIASEFATKFLNNRTGLKSTLSVKTRRIFHFRLKIANCTLFNLKQADLY